MDNFFKWIEDHPVSVCVILGILLLFGANKSLLLIILAILLITKEFAVMVGLAFGFFIASYAL